MGWAADTHTVGWHISVSLPLEFTSVSFECLDSGLDCRYRIWCRFHQLYQARTRVRFETGIIRIGHKSWHITNKIFSWKKYIGKSWNPPQHTDTGVLSINHRYHMKSPVRIFRRYWKCIFL